MKRFLCLLMVMLSVGCAGKDGTNGKNGLDGIQGEQGEQGLPGLDYPKINTDRILAHLAAGVTPDNLPPDAVYGYEPKAFEVLIAVGIKGEHLVPEAQSFTPIITLPKKNTSSIQKVSALIADVFYSTCNPNGPGCHYPYYSVPVHIVFTSTGEVVGTARGEIVWDSLSPSYARMTHFTPLYTPENN